MPARIRIHTTFVEEICAHGFQAVIRPYRYRARCATCSWAGDRRPNRERAEADARGHELSTGRPMPDEEVAVLQEVARG